MTDTGKWIRLTRTIDAPITTVWECWTKADLYQQWYGPMGMTIPVAELDATVGGTRKVCMQMTTPERTMQMWFTGQYKDITAPTRLVYTEAMCDENGTILSPAAMGMPLGTPEQTEVVVELADVDGKTQMTMEHVGIPAGSPGEGGWNQAIDKLVAFAENAG